MNPYEQMLGMVEFFLPQQSPHALSGSVHLYPEPARMLGRRRTAGTLEVGKKADFCVMKKDFCRAEPGEIGEFCAEYMVKDGKRYEQKKGTVWELVKMLFRERRRYKCV